MKGARRWLAALALAPLLGGCVGGVLEGQGPVTLAAVDPSLLETAQLLVFSFSTTQPCEELVDLAPAEIGAALADENAPLQPLENRQGTSHVFGDVPAGVPLAFFVLASAATRGELGQRIDFADLGGTVFAMACRDFEAAGGTRNDLPLTLFPVGLR